MTVLLLIYMLILILQKFEEDKGLCLGNDDNNGKLMKFYTRSKIKGWQRN